MRTYDHVNMTKSNVLSRDNYKPIPVHRRIIVGTGKHGPKIVFVLSSQSTEVTLVDGYRSQSRHHAKTNTEYVAKTLDPDSARKLFEPVLVFSSMLYMKQLIIV
jgi:hypothetical protein